MDRGFELLEKLTVVQWLLQRQRHRVRAESGPVVDPTCGQGRILALLKLKDDVSTKDLSTVLGMGVSSLNEMLGKLEKNGYVERHPSEDDKRVMLVTLTQKGRDADQEDDGPAELFSCLSNEEQEQLGDYLDRLIEALEGSMGEDGRATLEFARRRRDDLFARMHDDADFEGPGGPRGRRVDPRPKRTRERKNRSGREGGRA